MNKPLNIQFTFKYCSMDQVQKVRVRDDTLFSRSDFHLPYRKMDIWDFDQSEECRNNCHLTKHKIPNN